VPRRAAALLTVLLAACSAGGEGAAPAATSTTARPATSTTSTTAPPSTTTTTLPPSTTTTAPADTTLRPGTEGEAVRELQFTLVALGYWLGDADGTYGHLTQQAVLAFQKAAGLGRDGIAGPETLAALAVATRPTAASPDADGIEIDLARQLVLLVAGGEVQWAFNTSTGRSGWRTPAGTFRIERQIDGWRHAPLGDLYRPKYFRGGIALHGSTSIPGQPASHGCARVSIAAMDWLWSSGTAPIGTEVRVY
jgi:lipoprotein-anchoring transpeptidase ErfK/SrfK